MLYMGPLQDIFEFSRVWSNPSGQLIYVVE